MESLQPVLHLVAVSSCSPMREYLIKLPPGKIVLWCYLIWYLVIVGMYFDPAPAIWINSLGISAIIGFALFLSVSSPTAGEANQWQTFRLFLMPFCVSSFSSLIKGRGFIFIFPPRANELLFLFGSCAAFVFIVLVLKYVTYQNRA